MLKPSDEEDLSTYMSMTGQELWDLCKQSAKTKKKVFFFFFFGAGTLKQGFNGREHSSEEHLFVASYWIRRLKVPSVEESEKLIPFYRLQSGLSHAMQGFVRSLALEGTLAVGKLVGRVKPSVKWSSNIERAVENKERQPSSFYMVTIDVTDGVLGDTTCGCPIGFVFERYLLCRCF